MIPPGSRYERAERLFVQSHSYNEFGYPFLEGESPNLKIKSVNREAAYMPVPSGTRQDAPLLDYYVKDGESIQFLGYKFLGDAKRWHDIADANVNVWYPLDLTMGSYLGVPVTT
jgi:hypothetical protein